MPTLLLALAVSAVLCLPVYELETPSVTEGTLHWPLSSIAPATFSVHPGLVSPAEALELLALVRAVELDNDADSVDDLPTHELYLEKSGSFEAITTINGKPDARAATFAARLPTRTALAAIARPIVEERILPLVNARYSAACAVGGVAGRCRVCHSLIRRYHEGDRLSHPTHFDVQALVTAVIPLSTFATDFEGGLYVSTGAGYEGKEAFLPLHAGDAVLHQSTLLHGVNVTAGERWSWILWFKNAHSGAACEGVDASAWTAAAAAAGDPLAQFLHARRMRSAAESREWLRRAAEAGFSRAANEYGQACVEGRGGRKNMTEGRRYLAAAAAAGEPEGLYNLGLLETRRNATAAVALFREAAERGLGVAAGNVGVAFYNGMGVAQDVGEARGWFERAGDERSLLLAAQIARAGGDAQGAAQALLRAAKAGSKEARRLLRELEAGERHDL